MSKKDVLPKATSSSRDENSVLKAIEAMNRPWAESPALKAIEAMNRNWAESPALKAIEAMNRPWAESPALKAIEAMNRNWAESPALKAIEAMNKTWAESPALEAIGAMSRTWAESPALKAIEAMNRAWAESPALKALESASSAWISSPSFKAAVVAAQTLGISPNLERRARSSLSLERWGVTGAVTVDAVLDELANRAAPPKEQSADLQTSGDQSLSEVAELGPVKPALVTAPNQALTGVPTWALFFWLYILTPLVLVVINWEGARGSLVDLNARLPQTEVFAEIRNFVRTHLAGKPGDIRLVKGKNVRLREGPGTKFDVILLLPPGAPVVVLSKEDRTWLYVSYEYQGYVIDGYVSTKFLRKVRK
ncbi:SH3 domain-containing protein [Pseudomonas putida]|uniref:SH3 domain-containing protein n=1 Tax=Pseudomonas putida TaxID=303 RepID=UPI0009BE9573|nr:SH3 domain-containing protein [Pseudomonas putida]